VSAGKDVIFVFVSVLGLLLALLFGVRNPYAHDVDDDPAAEDGAR